MVDVHMHSKTGEHRESSCDTSTIFVKELRLSGGGGGGGGVTVYSSFKEPPTTGLHFMSPVMIRFKRGVIAPLRPKTFVTDRALQPLQIQPLQLN